MLEADTFVAARALIAAHGADALAVAERAAANVGRLGMIEKMRWWERVAAAVRRLEAADPSRALRTRPPQGAARSARSRSDSSTQR